MNTDWLDPLLSRHARRFKRPRRQIDLLPPEDVDLTALATQPVTPREGTDDERMRDIEQQFVHLSRIFEGKSELEFLHAACISYLRRKTDQQQRAAALFFRMWDEHGDFLAAQLSARWLVSALQTFYDHGRTGGERTAGAAGFLYGNLIKIYEGERAAVRPRVEPTSHRFWPELKTVKGLYSYRPGDDLLANTNVLVLDAAVNGGSAGLPLLRLMQHIHDGTTVFRRIDDLLEDPSFRNRQLYTLSWGETVSLADATAEAPDAQV